MMKKTNERVVGFSPARNHFLYLQGKKDVNNTSYWLTQLYHANIKVPETFILKLTANEYHILNRQSRTSEALAEEINCTKALASRLLTKLKENNFKSELLLVFKNHVSSSINLLDEYTPLSSNRVSDLTEEEMVKLIASFVSKNKGKVNELVIQGYYDNQKRPYIQNHIALTTRVRVSYSFETHEVLDIFNAWDSFKIKSQVRERTKTQEQTILDLAKLEKTIPVMNDEIRGHYYFLKDYIEKHFKRLKFKGEWIVDILITDKGYYVVEMKKEIPKEPVIPKKE